MRHVVKLVACVVVLTVYAVHAPAQEAGDPAGPRFLRWVGTPWSVRGFNERGNARASQGELDGAIADYTEAIRRDPRARVYYNRGVAWELKGDFDKAFADYSSAIQLPRGKSWPHGDRACVIRAHSRRAWLWKSRGGYDQAIAELTEAIRLDPGESWLYSNRGALWAEKGACDRAIADYSEAIRRDPRDATAHDHRAWLWATCADPAHRNGRQAVASATRACALTGWKDPDSLATLAAAEAEVGDFDAAVKWQEKVVTLTRAEKDRAQAREELALYRARKPYRVEMRPHPI